MGAGLTSFNGWGDSWGNSWGNDEPGAMVGSASFSISATGDLIGVELATDTHDGFWKRQWDKIREREKQSVKIEEIEEQIEEIKAAVITVATIEKAQSKPTAIDYSEQTRIIEALIARRAQLIEQEDEELLLLL